MIAAVKADIPASGFQFAGTSSPESTSRLLAAVASSAAAPALDPTALAARAVFGSLVDGRTPYQGIGARYVPYEALERFQGRPRDVAEARTALRRGLEAAVAHTLAGARRVAVLTGGGVDSSALLALAHRWAKAHRASAFAVAGEFGGEGDDRPHLAAVERHLGCEVIRVQPEEAAARVDLVLRGVDGAPFTWPWGPVEVELLSRAKAAGADVVLTGAGADELVDGHPTALAGIARRAPLRAARTARRLRGFRRPRAPVLSWVVRPMISPYIPEALRAWRARWRRDDGMPAWAGPVLLDYLAACERRDEAQSSPWHREHHEHIAWQNHQEEVAAGIRCRQPMLERSLRELVLGFEPTWLLDGDIRRGLFREAVRDLLPASVIERADKAVFEPGHDRFIAACGGVARFRDLASLEALEALGVVRPVPFQAEFAAFERGNDGGFALTTVWPVLAVESFVRSLSSAGRR